MADNRTSRDLVSREKTARYVYVEPTALPDPTPEPGWKFRWVATEIYGQSYGPNVSMRMREGWVPVRAEDHPELMLEGNAQGNVQIGGLMLCKMPEERAEARNEHYRVKAEQQVNSVDNTLLRQSDSRMPLFSERKSSTSFGKGNK